MRWDPQGGGRFAPQGAAAPRLAGLAAPPVPPLPHQARQQEPPAAAAPSQEGCEEQLAKEEPTHVTHGGISIPTAEIKSGLSPRLFAGGPAGATAFVCDPQRKCETDPKQRFFPFGDAAPAKVDTAYRQHTRGELIRHLNDGTVDALTLDELDARLERLERRPRLSLLMSQASVLRREAALQVRDGGLHTLFPVETDEQWLAYIAVKCDAERFGHLAKLAREVDRAMCVRFEARKMPGEVTYYDVEVPLWVLLADEDDLQPPQETDSAESQTVEEEDDGWSADEGPNYGKAFHGDASASPSKTPLTSRST